MSTPTPEDLAAMQARCDEATQGPWSVEVITGDIEIYGDEDEILSRGVSGGDGVGLNRGVEYELFDACDAEFIAHARTDLPRLLDEVERLKAQMNAIDDKVGGDLFTFGTADPAYSSTYSKVDSLVKSHRDALEVKGMWRDAAEKAESCVAELENHIDNTNASISNLEKFHEDHQDDAFGAKRVRELEAERDELRERTEKAESRVAELEGLQADDLKKTAEMTSLIELATARIEKGDARVAELEGREANQVPRSVECSPATQDAFDSKEGM